MSPLLHRSTVISGHPRLDDNNRRCIHKQVCKANNIINIGFRDRLLLSFCWAGGWGRGLYSKPVYDYAARGIIHLDEWEPFHLPAHLQLKSLLWPAEQQLKAVRNCIPEVVTVFKVLE